MITQVNSKAVLEVADDPRLSRGTKAFLQLLNSGGVPLETLSPLEARQVLVDAQASLQLLDEKYGNERSRNEYLDNLFSQLKIELKFFARELERKKLKPISSIKFR